jgi:hypothetical protein
MPIRDSDDPAESMQAQRARLGGGQSVRPDGPILRLQAMDANLLTLSQNEKELCIDLCARVLSADRVACALFRAQPTVTTLAR